MCVRACVRMCVCVCVSVCVCVCVCVCAACFLEIHPGSIIDTYDCSIALGIIYLYYNIYYIIYYDII